MAVTPSGFVDCLQFWILQKCVFKKLFCLWYLIALPSFSYVHWNRSETRNYTRHHSSGNLQWYTVLDISYYIKKTLLKPCKIDYLHQLLQFSIISLLTIIFISYIYILLYLLQIFLCKTCGTDRFNVANFNNLCLAATSSLSCMYLTVLHLQLLLYPS